MMYIRIGIVFLAVSFSTAFGQEIRSIESDATGLKMQIEGAPTNLSAPHLYRRSENSDRWVRVLPNYVVDENGVWSEAIHSESTFTDTNVAAGARYCYAYAASINAIDASDESCVSFSPGGGNPLLPTPPEDIWITGVNVHNIRLAFVDASTNESEFVIERRVLPAPWETVGSLEPSDGVDNLRTFRDSNVDMGIRYCYRVTAVNTRGTSTSNIVCRTSGWAVLQSTEPVQRGVLTNFGHFVTDGLTATVLYDTANVSRTIHVGVFDLTDTQGSAIQIKTLSIPAGAPMNSAKVHFENLDPHRRYCARIKTRFNFDTEFERPILCESPFGMRTSTSHVGPTENELPLISEIIGVFGARLKIEIDNPQPNQLIDVVRATDGFRETRTFAANGAAEVTLGNLRGRTVYCMRTFVTNQFGSRYGYFDCEETPSPPGGGSGIGMGSSGGSPAVPLGLRSGVDCNCTKTGAFVNPTPPSSVSTSSDGKYRVEQTTTSLSVFNVSTDARLFHETSLTPGFSFGFGPRTRYFLFAFRLGPSSVTVVVVDLDDVGGDNRKLFVENIPATAGYGFSSDGGTAFVSRITTLGTFGITLQNLDSDEQNQLISFQAPFSAFNQFSPCGDVLVVANNFDPTGPITFGLFKTEDSSTIISGSAVSPTYTGVFSTDESHVVRLAAGSDVVLGTNEAAQACSTAGDAEQNYELQTVQFPGASLSDGEADVTYAESGSILQTDSGTNDVSCDVSFAKSGAVETSTLGDGVIDTLAELNAVLAAPGNAKVVNQLNYCGDNIQTVVLGCADKPGTSFVFVRTEDEAITVAHEFGHNKGLDHRDDDIDNLMHTSGGLESVKINDAECAAFLSSGISSGVAPFRISQSSLDPANVATVSGPSRRNRVSITDFVQRNYYEGIPYHSARAYGPSDIPALLNMLSDHKNVKWWPNIVSVIGLVGDNRVVPILIDFIERDPATDHEAEYRAKRAATISLGYLVNHVDDQVALNYLKASAYPSAWEERKMKNKASYHATNRQRNDDLSRAAILGLTLSGSLDARELIEALTARASKKGDRRFANDNRQFLSDTIKELDRVAVGGLSRYYERR